MDYRQANRAYMFMIIATIWLVVVLSLWYLNGGPAISILSNNVMSEAVVLIPALAAVFYSGDRLSVVVPFHKIRIGSFFLVILYVITLFPLVTLVNALSMIFVENTVSAISDEVLAMPLWTMLLSIGIIGPLVEEVVFRGVILQSYQRTGRIVGSIILSSVLFGMMHMNFNQFAYGAVMGIMLALLVEATGSITASCIAHATFNSIEVVLMYASSGTLDEVADTAANTLGTVSGVYYAFLLVMALVFTYAAIKIAGVIADLEGRKEFFDNILKTKKQGYKLISWHLVVATVIALAYMIFYTVLL